LPFMQRDINTSETYFGHPRGLYVLFFTEMWERFSFYGMKSLLIFYLVQHWMFDDGASAGLVATYGSLVYLTPILGGAIADRYLGFRRSVIFGAALLAIGHLLMTVEGTPATLNAQGVIQRDSIALDVFYLALSFIIVGVGFLKPSISSMVGQLYTTDERRRDSGFTLFYMGINLGALSAMLICGYLGQTYGWKYGFGLAGIGMILGLFTFLRGRSWLLGIGEPPGNEILTEKVGPFYREHWIYFGGIIGIVCSWILIQRPIAVGWLLGFTSFVAVVGIIVYSILYCSPVERNRHLIVLYLTAVSVVFWMFFEQAGTSMALFTERNVDKNLLGFEMQASQMGFMNPAFIILCAPFFSFVWDGLAKRGLEPSTTTKFGLGVIQVGIGFMFLVMGGYFADAMGQVALVWLTLAYFLHTTGELSLSPVGLSMVTKLSITRLVGLMMGVWFLSSAGAHYIAGEIAKFASVDRVGGQSVDPSQSLAVYLEVFSTLGWVAILVGIAVLVSAPYVSRIEKRDIT